MPRRAPLLRRRSPPAAARARNCPPRRPLIPGAAARRDASSSNYTVKVLALLIALLSEPPRVQAARAASSTRIEQLFQQAAIAYPPRRVLLRAFKQERELELWAGADAGEMKRITTYAICASSGEPGEKTRAGDGQVPEGFYRVSALNPHSNFLLSLRVSYPNARDRKLRHGGGDIFIHGSCVTIGCIPIEDGPIQELYLIAS